MSAHLRPGKLPADDLAAILRSVSGEDPRVLVGPRVGEDAAVIDVGGSSYIAVAADPITLASEGAGSLVVSVNANDVACLGARPRYFLAVLLLPPGTTAASAHSLIADIAATCRETGVTLCGGHTEITLGISAPIVVGTMIGEVTPGELVTKQRLRPGDQVLITHGAAIEGTAILARERTDALRASLDAETIGRAQRLLIDPGISVVRAAEVARRAGRVSAMHDPTEGGVVGGLCELASASGLGIRARLDRVPVLTETRAVCSALEIDALRLIASGALLVAAPPREIERVVEALVAAGIPARVVAEMRPAEEGLLAEAGGRVSPLELPERDELARFLDAGSATVGGDSWPGLESLTPFQRDALRLAAKLSADSATEEDESYRSDSIRARAKTYRVVARELEALIARHLSASQAAAAREKIRALAVDIATACRESRAKHSGRRGGRE